MTSNNLPPDGDSITGDDELDAALLNDPRLRAHAADPTQLSLIVSPLMSYGVHPTEDGRAVHLEACPEYGDDIDLVFEPEHAVQIGRFLLISAANANAQRAASAG